MTGINFSDDIHARGRKLHLQTNTLEADQKIISTLYDGGRVLCQDSGYYSSRHSTEQLKKEIEVYHSKKIEEIELLYLISAKVKTVRHPLSLNMLGLQFLKWNLLDEAISELELVIQYQPQYGEAYLSLGEAYYRRGGLSEAEQYLEKGVQVAPRYADLWQKLGRICLAQEQYKKSIEAFQSALKINPTYDEAHFMMAVCLTEALAKGIQEKGFPQGEICQKQIKEHLSRAAASSSRFTVPAFEQAMRMFHRSEVKGTLELLRKVDEDLTPIIDLNFHHAFYLKYMFGDEGRDAKSIQDYVQQLEALIKKHPTFPDLHNMLGVAYLIQCRGLFNKALHEINRACEINPEYERAKRNLKLAKNEGKGFLILLRSLLK
ncbi:tetratricopeptide repeat protein [bacterium]|nr:tetratricopeptide repeat protein [bacterium]RQV94315.1 MAG: tetratricopeptide repeat protein [bacterium]